MVRNERGGGDQLAALLVTPAILAVVFVLIQFALWWQADQQVEAAAQAGAEVARTTSATPAGVDSAARAIAADLDGFTLTRGQAAATVTVSVTATAPALVPLDQLTRVEATVTLPRERVSAP